MLGAAELSVPREPRRAPRWRCPSTAAAPLDHTSLGIMSLACATFWRVTNALHSARPMYPLSARKSVLNLSFNRRSSEMRVLGLLLTASLWALIAKADQPVYFQ